MTKNIPFFPNLHIFVPLNDVRACALLVLKNNPYYMNFFTRMISNFKYKCPPPPAIHAELTSCFVQISDWKLGLLYLYLECIKMHFPKRRRKRKKKRNCTVTNITKLATKRRPFWHDKTLKCGINIICQRLGPVVMIALWLWYTQPVQKHYIWHFPIIWIMNNQLLFVNFIH